MNAIKINKIMNLILLILVVYSFFTFIEQQKKISSYNTKITYLTSEIDELNAKKEELKEIEKNVNSEEYIEEIARKSLGMYHPSEIVYIDINK